MLALSDLLLMLLPNQRERVAAQHAVRDAQRPRGLAGRRDGGVQKVRVRGHAREDDARLAELVRRVDAHVRAGGVALAAPGDEERAREAVDAGTLEALEDG